MYPHNDLHFIEELQENHQRELHISKRTFTEGKSDKSIHKAVKAFYKRLDRQIAGNIEKHDIPLVCSKGCSHCCTLRVELFGYEVIAIANHIRDSFSTAEFAEVTKKLAEASESAKGLRMEEHFVPCALLKDGICSIYEMRPAMCRKFSSLSLESCLDNCQAAENRGLKESTMAAYHGFAEGARQGGLRKTLYELNQALNVAVNKPLVWKRWINGSEVFVPIPLIRSFHTV
jgi:Fe-S-cluster containining protein